METCADEWRDKDDRGGGLTMPHGHLHGARATHYRVRAAARTGAPRGKVGEAEVEGDKMVQKARFLSFSIVKHMGSHENMPIHCLTVYRYTRVNKPINTHCDGP